MMRFKELQDFLESKMKLSHIYQPLLLKSLIEAGGTATIRHMATCTLLAEKKLKEMPIKVLSKHGVIVLDGDLISLTTQKLTFKQKDELKKICEDKLQEYMLGKREDGCPFCERMKTQEILIENDFSFAILDSYPVSKGHTLVIPKRHVADYFEMAGIEQNAVNDLLRIRRKQLLETDPLIDGFNVGVNCGKAAGQTIFHCHIHLIPRRLGDTDHPEGGVRGVIPNKMSY